MDPKLLPDSTAKWVEVKAGNGNGSPAGLGEGGSKYLVLHDLSVEDRDKRGSPVELSAWKLVFDQVFVTPMYVLDPSAPRLSSAHGLVVKPGWSLGVRFLDAKAGTSTLRVSVNLSLEGP